MTTDAVGGVWTYATELAAALRERDVEVTLAVLGPAPTEEQRRRHGVAHIHEGRLEWQDDPWGDVTDAGGWLLELADDVRPDAVHLNGYAHGALSWPAPVIVVAHSCVLSWWEAVRGGPAPASWERYRRAVTAGLLGADSVVAPTASMLAALRRIYGLGGRGSVIPNGIRDRTRPAPKERFVLAAGRLWDEAKGLDVLDEAAARISRPVEVAGDAGAARAHAVRTLGHVPPERLRSRMESAAVFAHPARYEPFGLAPLEAALARCALVLGDISTLREVWGPAATYVAPGDGAALADALERLLALPGERDALATRARARALEYGAERMAWSYAEEYARLAAGTRVRA